MTLIRDASRRSGITPEGAYNAYELAEVGPTGDPWIRNRLVDGQTGAGAAMPSERNDGQLGGVPLDSDRWVVWYERFTEMPNTTLDRWQVVGPEIHGPNVSEFPQALLMLEVGPDKHRRLNANAGRGTTRYRDIGPIGIGAVYAMRMHVRLSSGNDGIITVWRDGVVAAEIQGPTIWTAINGSYWKEANYRNADIDGVMTHDFSSLRIFDADPGDLTGGPVVIPPPGDTAKPVIVHTLPAAGQTYPLDAIPYDFTVTDADEQVKVWMGLGGTEASVALTGPGRHQGVLDATGKVTAGTEWAYIAATDTAGNEADPWSAAKIGRAHV